MDTFKGYNFELYWQDERKQTDIEITFKTTLRQFLLRKGFIIQRVHTYWKYFSFFLLPIYKLYIIYFQYMAYRTYILNTTDVIFIM